MYKLSRNCLIEIGYDAQIDAVAFTLLMGVALAAADMQILGPTGFRMVEPVALSIIWLEGGINNTKVRRSTLITVFFMIVFSLLVTPSSTYWFFKMMLLVLTCQICIRQRLPLSNSFLLGATIGYTMYSLLLEFDGDGFIAKYSSIHCSIYLLLLWMGRNKEHRVFSIILLCISLVVAIYSNSRGQILLLASAMCAVAIFHIKKLKHFQRKAVLLLVFLGPQLMSLPIKDYYFHHVIAAGTIGKSNAGDFERSILGVYSIVSFPENLQGQAQSRIESALLDRLDLEGKVRLQTTSAHNVFEDSMLYGGAPGLLFFFLACASMMHQGARALAQRTSDRTFQAVLLGVLIISFIFATSPMSGIERIQIILVSSLLGSYLKRNGRGI